MSWGPSLRWDDALGAFNRSLRSLRAWAFSPEGKNAHAFKEPAARPSLHTALSGRWCGLDHISTRPVDLTSSQAASGDALVKLGLLARLLVAVPAEHDTSAGIVEHFAALVFVEQSRSLDRAGDHRLVGARRGPDIRPPHRSVRTVEIDRST